MSSWTESIAPRLKLQLDFLVAVDALKMINRASRIADNSRRENSAEHSWHIALFARILQEYADEAIDIERVTMMLLLHDIVEIDAGDVPLHGQQDPDQSSREQAAADRLFNLLPDDQAGVLRSFWDEFELAESADARFANAVDRLQPVLLNMMTEGGTWSEYKVSIDEVKYRTRQIGAGSDALQQAADAMFIDALALGWLKTAPPAAES